MDDVFSYPDNPFAPPILEDDTNYAKRSTENSFHNASDWRTQDGVYRSCSRSTGEKKSMCEARVGVVMGL